MQVYFSKAQLADEITDWLLLWQLYWLSMEPENRQNASLKAALLVVFFSVLSTHLVAYSSIINMQLN